VIEDLKQVLSGKSTIIKNKQYLSAKDYIQPFLDRLDPLGVTYMCQVKQADQLSVTDSTPDIIYNRVHIQAVFPESNDNGCKKVIGFVYGIDVKIPVAKFYTANVDGKGNLLAFDTNGLIVQKLEDATPIDYSPISTLLNWTDNSTVMIKQLKNTYIDRDRLIKFLGEWVDLTIDQCVVNDGGKVKLATSLPVDVYKSILKDKDSDYYITETNAISFYDIYTTFLGKIKEDDKDIVNRYEKTLLVDKILKL
jgi:hypothetical protein